MIIVEFRGRHRKRDGKRWGRRGRGQRTCRGANSPLLRLQLRGPCIAADGLGTGCCYCCFCCCCCCCCASKDHPSRRRLRAVLLWGKRVVMHGKRKRMRVWERRVYSAEGTQKGDLCRDSRWIQRHHWNHGWEHCRHRTKDPQRTGPCLQAEQETLWWTPQMTRERAGCSQSSRKGCS